MNSNNRIARMAGLLYLMFIGTATVADLIGHFNFGDAKTIVNNIMDHGLPFRIGFVISLLSAVLFLLAAWALYVTLRPVNKDLALLFLVLNLAGVAVQCASMLDLFAGQLLLSGADYLRVFQANQLQALATLAVILYRYGYMISQVFYGLWLFPLGYLAYKSGLIPRILGTLLIIDGFGVLIWFFQFFLSPGHDVIAYPGLAESFIAEVSLSLWLLIKGVKGQKPIQSKPDDGERNVAAMLGDVDLPGWESW